MTLESQVSDRLRTALVKRLIDGEDLKPEHDIRQEMGRVTRVVGARTAYALDPLNTENPLRAHIINLCLGRIPDGEPYDLRGLRVTVKTQQVPDRWVETRLREPYPNRATRRRK